MTLRRIAFEPVNSRGLGGSEGEPVLRVLLEQAKELLAVSLGGLVDFVPAFELALEAEFSDELFFVAARSPDGDVRLGSDLLAEV